MLFEWFNNNEIYISIFQMSEIHKVMRTNTHTIFGSHSIDLEYKRIDLYLSLIILQEYNINDYFGFSLHERK